MSKIDEIRRDESPLQKAPKSNIIIHLNNYILSKFKILEIITGIADIPYRPKVNQLTQQKSGMGNQLLRKESFKNQDDIS